MTVTVITDSAAALPAELAVRHGIVVVPLWLQVGEDSYRDGEIGLDELLRRRDSEAISTASPSPGDFARAIADAHRRGPAVILTVAAGMSTTNDAAVLAAKLVGDDVAASPGRVEGRDVTVLDTGTAAGAQALVALAAARTAAEGGDLAAVVAMAERAAGLVRLMAAVADVETLASSGRVPEAARWIGGRLGVRPLFEFRDGRARPLRPAFSAEAARSRIVARCAAGARPGARLHANVLHALNPEGAEALAEMVAPLGPATSLIGPFSPVMVAHTGRGLCGLAWWWET
jgi:DegV family protein with EDD domain